MLFYPYRFPQIQKGDVKIDKQMGGALAVVLILLMVASTLFNNYLTKRSGKGRVLYEKENPCIPYLAGFTMHLPLLPFFVTLIYSLFTEWTGILPRAFTLRNYQLLFSDLEFWTSLLRTMMICVISVAASIVTLLLAMYVVVIGISKAVRIIQFICMIPYALQGCDFVHQYRFSVLGNEYDFPIA